jgi:hypothetical protein
MTSEKITVYTRIMASGLSTDQTAPSIAFTYFDWNSRLTLPSTKPR